MPEENNNELTGSLQQDFPTIINGVTYHPFKRWRVSFNDSVTTHETEGGTQEDTVTRKGRRSISVSTKCLEPLARQLSALNDLDKFAVKFYDIKTAEYVEIDMRIAPGSMDVDLAEKTADLEYCRGIYTVSFTLEEF